MASSDAEPDDEFKAKAVAMIMDGLGQAEIEFANSVCAPFFWAMHRNDGTEEIKNGSLFFLDTGQRVFVVTAAHVLKECLNDTRSRRFIQCMIAGPRMNFPFSIGERVIDANADLDMATIHFTREEIERLGKTILHGYQHTWPPRLCEVEGPITYSGYPGSARKLLGPREILWGIFSAAGIVTSANEISVSIQIDRANLKQILGDGTFVENYDFLGTSGGPLIAIIQTNIFRMWKPAGVIIQGPNPIVDNSQSIMGFELIKARPIDYILADGFLDNDRWAMNNIQRHSAERRDSDW